MSARRPFALAATGVALTLTLAACGTGDHTAMSPTSGSPTSAQTGMGRDADIAFAQLMIPHHQQAVDMADLALVHASSEQVKVLAAQIKAAQDPEIRQMQGWLSGWGAPEQMAGATASDGSMDHSDMDMGGMSSAGMMTAQDMQYLAEARGTDFDRTWLAMMIAHHQGALTMAKQVLTTTNDAAVEALAQAVVAGQTDEVTAMQKLLVR